MCPSNKSAVQRYQSWRNTSAEERRLDALLQLNMAAESQGTDARADLFHKPEVTLHLIFFYYYLFIYIYFYIYFNISNLHKDNFSPTNLFYHVFLKQNIIRNTNSTPCLALCWSYRIKSPDVYYAYLLARQCVEF